MNLSYTSSYFPCSCRLSSTGGCSGTRSELASVKKGTESLQAELKEVSGKVTSLEEDVAAKDALLGK